MNPEMGQALAWAMTLVHVVLDVALIVVAFLRARRASPAAGYLLAAGGALDALSSCCARGVATYARSLAASEGYEAAERLWTMQGLLGITSNVLVTGLIIAGFVVGARALGTARPA